MGYDRDKTVDAGFQKMHFLPILQNYEQIGMTPPLIGNTVEVVQKIDEAAERAFQFGYTDKQFSKEVGTYVQSCQDATQGVICKSAARGAIFYYLDLFKNDWRAERLGRAKAFLLYADECESGEPSAKLKDLASKNVAEAKVYCDEGDKFFCGIHATLQDILNEKIWVQGFLGQVFAPYFGVNLWCEHDGDFDSIGCEYKRAARL